MPIVRQVRTVGSLRITFIEPIIQQTIFKILYHANRWMTWLHMPKKDATNCEKPWRDVRSLWTMGVRMRLLFKSERIGNSGNWNVLVPEGIKINWDAASKSDWTQHLANWIFCSNALEMWCCRLFFSPNFLIRSELESFTIQGDSPVWVRLWM